MRGRAAFRIVPALVAGITWSLAAAPDAIAATRLDAEFVALLAHRGARRHPLSDASGRLPLVVEVSPDVDPRAQGFLPLSSGLAAVHVAPRDLPSFVKAHPGAHFSIWPGLHPVLDASARLNRTTDYRAALAAQGSKFAGTGKGVVVGIVDTGIDLFHADFRAPTGQTRVAWMLDFARPPLGVHPELEATYGCTTPGQSICAVLQQNDIDRALASDGTIGLSDDPIGHGTHVTSIAAGNGGSDARFVGGAPEATLIIASVAHSGAATVADIDVVTAVRFIFEQAEKMGMPAVVNVSLGGDFGPHDGTTPLEVSLAELVGTSHPGRSIVVAAGNSGAIYQGDDPDQVLGIHTETRVTDGADAKINVFTPDAKSDVSGSVLVWLTYGATDSIKVGFQGANGSSIRPVAIGRTGGYQASDDSFTAAIYNGAVGGDSPLPPSSHGAIVVWDGKWPASSKMTLTLEGEGAVNAWVEATFDDSLSSGGVYFELASRAGTISVPATHPDLIAVGCTNNRTEWTDRDGFAHDLLTTAYRALGPVDASCYFSSAGPTATGVMKPDISAPGAMVAGAMSRDAVPPAPQSSFSAPSELCPDGNECLVVDGGHALLSGSSMSSPQVAGAIALLFERDPRLTQP
ncbi:MAG: S8 family serine peptidase, partial [Polyangiaceae bacterium]